MSQVTVSAARANFADVVDEARMGRGPVFLTKRGKPVVAVVDVGELQALLAAAEDLADLRAVRAARDEVAAGAEPIPWDELKAELGLA